MLRFQLEDFFDKYEHQPNFINLASSDALPWSTSVLDADVSAEIARESLGYPDPERLLTPLKSALALHPVSNCCPPRVPPNLLPLPCTKSQRRGRNATTLSRFLPSYGAFRGLASLLGFKVRQYGYRSSADWQPDVDEMYALEGMRNIYRQQPSQSRQLHHPEPTSGRFVQDTVTR